MIDIAFLAMVSHTRVHFLMNIQPTLVLILKIIA